MAKKKTTLRRSNAGKATVVSTNDLFEILTDPPPPVRGATPETVAFIAKLDRTLLHIKLGQAFIIPGNKKPLVERHIKATLPLTEERFTFMKIADNPGFVRVYRLPIDKKTKSYKK